MKLQLEVPTTWTAETLAQGNRRYLVPGGKTAADLVVVIRESLPLPLDLAAWPLAALAQLQTTLASALPAPLAAALTGAGAKPRLHVQSAVALNTTSGWPATLVEAILLDERDQPVAGCVAALYRFLAYGAEAMVVATDRARFTALREALLNVLATGRPLWPAGEPPSLHHMVHDDPT